MRDFSPENPFIINQFSQDESENHRKKISQRQVTNYGSWENAFSLKMFEDEDFSVALNESTFNMGNFMFLRVQWEMGRHNFPLLFHVSECSVSKGDLSFGFKHWIA